MSRARDRVGALCAAFEHDRERLLDVLHTVQRELGAVTREACEEIAGCLGFELEHVTRVVNAFEAFANEPAVRVRVSDDPVSRMLGSAGVADAVADELRAGHGVVARGGLLGFGDQSPAIRIGDMVLPGATPERARRDVRAYLSHRDEHRLARTLGEGANAHPLVQSPVRNNIRQVGPIILHPMDPAAPVRRALSMSCAEVIRTIKTARLRGRRLDGLPTGIKWDLARAATFERAERDCGASLAAGRDYARELDVRTAGERRYVICNACDAEPGVFSTRVLLTERPGRVFAGMTIAGYAVGAERGIVYLADELAYLKGYLEDQLARRRADRLLGEDILGRRGVCFDIRIRHGSGPYALGEETAVINACEGRLPVPRPRPPYPTQEGYRGWPTIVHGAETLCCVASIMELGPAAFSESGTAESKGTRLLCLSGDCRAPGLYEFPYGIAIEHVLGLTGAEDAAAVFASGAAPALLAPSQFGRRIAHEDAETSGALVVLGPGRDPLRVLTDLGRFYLDATAGFGGDHDADRRCIGETLDAMADDRAAVPDLDRLREAAARIAEDRALGFGRAPGRLVLNSIETLGLAAARGPGAGHTHAASP